MQMVMLDAQTYDNKFRLSSFGVEAEDMLKDFFEWIQETGIKSEDLWYADIFSMNDDDDEEPKRVCSINLLENGSAELIPKADGLSPFKKRTRPLKVVLANLGKQFSKSTDKDIT